MDVSKVRKDFHILEKRVRGKPIIYFDSACMALKPKQVIDAVNSYYNDFTACHGRSVHYFSAQTTEKYIEAHRKVERFIGAKENEVVFTKNCTEAINLVANGLKWEKGDRVITTKMEHNSNLIPWMKLAKERGVVHDYVEVDNEGKLDIEDLNAKLETKTKLVSLVYTSNVTGATLNASEVAKICHDAGAMLLLDGAQAVPHMKVDVKKTGVDFLAFSGHKMLGPSGTGALYGRLDLLKGMNQFIVGGETVKNTMLSSWEAEDSPAKFEAGLQDYAGMLGFGAAADYLMRLGMEEVHSYEKKLARKLYDGLKAIPQVTNIYGPSNPEERSALASFTLKGMNPQEVALILDESANIFVRSGMHCCHLYHQDVIHEMHGTIRPSLYIYNTDEELDKFFDALRNIAALA